MSAPHAKELLCADPEAIARLVASDYPTWKILVQEIAPARACPPALLRALLAIDDAKGWQERCDVAHEQAPPEQGGHRLTGHYVFRPWFARAVIEHVPPIDLASLEHRYQALLVDGSRDATRRARELTVDIEKTRDAEDRRPLLGRALMLLAFRSSEDRDEEGVMAAAQHAEEVFASLGDETSRAMAVRARGAALLRLRRIDEALALLETVADVPAGSRPFVESRSLPAVRPEDEAFVAAASLAEIGSWSEPWFEYLAKIAVQTKRRDLRERAEAGLLHLEREKARQEAEAARASGSEDDDIPAACR